MADCAFFVLALLGVSACNEKEPELAQYIFERLFPEHTHRSELMNEFQTFKKRKHPSKPNVGAQDISELFKEVKKADKMKMTVKQNSGDSKNC